MVIETGFFLRNKVLLVLMFTLLYQNQEKAHQLQVNLTLVLFHFQIRYLKKEQMPIFNQTFTDDKPIYYPANWETGKTADQLYNEWKQTYQFFFITNFLQILCASIWLFLLFVILVSVKELWRIYNLADDCRQKMYNQKFIRKGFLVSTAIIALMACIVTIGFFFDQFIRNALLKGGSSITLGLLLYWVYKNGKDKYEQSKRKKNSYRKIEKEKQQETTSQ